MSAAATLVYRLLFSQTCNTDVIDRHCYHIWSFIVEQCFLNYAVSQLYLLCWLISDWSLTDTLILGVKVQKSRDGLP